MKSPRVTSAVGTSGPRPFLSATNPAAPSARTIVAATRTPARRLSEDQRDISAFPASTPSAPRAALPRAAMISTDALRSGISFSFVPWIDTSATNDRTFGVIELCTPSGATSSTRPSNSRSGYASRRIFAGWPGAIAPTSA